MQKKAESNKDREYLVNDYSKFWDRQSYKYGIGTYEAFLIKLLKGAHPDDAFEVCIGNGWPIAKSLVESGIQVSGCDIAPSLIESARKMLSGGGLRNGAYSKRFF